MGTLVLAGATSGSTTLTPTDAVTATITMPSATCTLAGVGVNVGSPITNSLTGNVTLNNTSNYFTGPTVAQGSTGTWLASGSVVMIDTAGGAIFDVKLWDGTTLIAETRVVTTSASQEQGGSVSGFITSPAGNIRISVRDVSSTSGQIRFNSNSDGSKTATLTAFRIG